MHAAAEWRLRELYEGSRRPRRWSLRRDGTVEIVLLRGMDPHERFDRDDEPLRVMDEISIGRLCREVRRRALEQPGDM